MNSVFPRSLMSLTFIRSLLITSTFSFAAPVLLIGVLVVSLSLIEQVPLIQAIAQGSAEKILQFLAVFGSGDAVQGALVIGFTCGLVGALFDTYAFYRHHDFRDS